MLTVNAQLREKIDFVLSYLDVHGVAGTAELFRAFCEEKERPHLEPDHLDYCVGKLLREKVIERAYNPKTQRNGLRRTA